MTQICHAQFSARLHFLRFLELFVCFFGKTRKTFLFSAQFPLRYVRQNVQPKIHPGEDLTLHVRRVERSRTHFRSQFPKTRQRGTRILFRRQKEQARSASVVQTVDRTHILRGYGSLGTPDRMFGRHGVKMLFFLRKNLPEKLAHPVIESPSRTDALRDDESASIHVVPQLPAIFRTQYRILRARRVLPRNEKDGREKKIFDRRGFQIHALGREVLFPLPFHKTRQVTDVVPMLIPILRLFRKLHFRHEDRVTSLREEKKGQRGCDRFDLFAGSGAFPVNEQFVLPVRHLRKTQKVCRPFSVPVVPADEALLRHAPHALQTVKIVQEPVFVSRISRDAEVLFHPAARMA